MEEEAKKDKLRKVQEGRIAIPGKFMIKTSALLDVVKTLKEGEEKRREEKVRKDQEADVVPPWSRDWSPSPPLDSPRFPADSEEEAEEAKERRKVNCADEMYYDGRR
jgi:chromatin segregation and condensation protein Rec8/ScpA/Scc1 (kleisin family)